ncbi:TetR/AcrR family transcriptional regulator [Massilia sp.]|uniref:TetR/AcrR family transcriptional regulator n=1 Tax=Massilia sp. TaxID=1882437 RepID=UPI0028A8F2B4|nr:TetR/AcrR family transcriptional regulator [Massilia sp.]
MEEPVNASRMTQRYAKKREAILHEAARLFNRSGMKGATLSDVAGAVGLSTNSITYYYKKKEDLVVACLLRSIETVSGIIAAAAQEAGPEQRVRGFVTLFFERLARTAAGDVTDGSELMTFRDVHLLGSPHSEIVFAAYVEMFRKCRRLLASGPIKPGKRVELNARTHLLLTLTLWTMSWSGRYNPEDYGVAAARMADILVGGIGAKTARWGTTALDDALAAALSAPSGSESAQDAFLRAATALINEAGYRGASVERISARLNLTKGAFYHHHPSKEDLIAACFERKFTVIREFQRIAMVGKGSGWDKLCAVSRALVRHHFSEHGPLLRTSAWSELPEEMRVAKLDETSRLDRRFVSLLVDGMQDGSIRPLDQAIAGDLVSGMVNAAVLLDRWVPDVNGENALELFVRPLFEGLLAER